MLKVNFIKEISNKEEKLMLKKLRSIVGVWGTDYTFK